MTKCRCGFAMLALPAPGGVVFVCRRCDTSAQSGMQRVGPPRLPDTRDGWFTATWRD